MTDQRFVAALSAEASLAHLAVTSCSPRPESAIFAAVLADFARHDRPIGTEIRPTDATHRLN